MPVKQTTEELKEEAKIINRAKQDPEVFGLIYEKYYKPVFLFVNRRTADADATADITSQVFLKAMLKLHQWKFKGLPFSAWLFRIATNQINEHYRNINGKRTISLKTEHASMLFEDIEVDADINPVELIPRLIDQLEEDEVELLELRYFEQRSFKEVAFILNISEGNAKVRVHRILKKMKKYV